jgi:hypothetical protein
MKKRKGLDEDWSLDGELKVKIEFQLILISSWLIIG